MGFLQPAIPWIAKGAAALGGHLLARKAQSSAMARSPEEQQALQGAQSSATSLAQSGSQLLGQGAPMLQQAGDYWSTLLRGSRAAMAQATAGPRAALTDVYRGAERGLERSGVRGAARDVASADLARDRAGQIARLTTGQQPLAAQQLAGVGGTALSTGANLASNAGSIWGNLLGAGTANRQYGRQEGEKAGSSIGSLLFDVITGFGGKKSAPMDLGFDIAQPRTSPYIASQPWWNPNQRGGTVWDRIPGAITF